MVETPEQPRALRIAQWGRIRWWNACAWYLVTLAEALARRGHASFVFAPDGTPITEQARERGLPTPSIGDLGSGDPRVAWPALRRVARWLEREAIGVVNIHSGPGHAALAALCRARGIAVVRTRGDIRLPRAHPLQRWLYRRLTDHHLAAADFLRESAYPPLGIDPRGVTVLRGGIDLAPVRAVDRDRARREVRAQLGLAPETLLVGMVARLSPVKGHRDVIAALARLGDLGPRVHAAFAGGEAQLRRSDLADLAQEAGVGDRVHLVGRVERPLDWAAAFDVAVIASTDSEAICRSAFEYLALGLPLVATRVHAIAEVVRPEAGLLVPPGDPEAIAGALRQVLTDLDLRARLSAAGPRHIDAHYSLDRFGAAAEAMFARVVATRRGAHG